MATTLLVTNDFPPRIGGIESFGADVCAMLGGDVVVYTSGPPGAEATDAARGFPVVREGTLLLPTPGVAARALSLLRAHRASRVVFGAAAPLGLLAPTLRRDGAERIVGITHGHEIWWARVPAARQALRAIGEECDHLTAISDFTQIRIGGALSAAARRRMLRLAPPVDTSLFRPTGSSGELPRCIAVGRFVPRKGFVPLLLAWRQVIREGSGAPFPGGDPELVLVGDGPQRPQLEQLIADLGLARSVRLAGPLDRAGVIAELQHARVFAMPVRTRLAGFEPEGLGLAALEAAACGLPVVVGESGGAPETVRHGETGYVVPGSDHRALARRIRLLLADPAHAAAMGARGRSLVVDRFGIERARTTLRQALHLPSDP